MTKTILIALVMILLISNVTALEINLTDIEAERESKRLQLPEMRLEKVNSSTALLTITNPLKIPIVAMVSDDIWAFPEFYSSDHSRHIKMGPGETYEEMYNIEAKASTINIRVRTWFLYENLTFTVIPPQQDEVALVSYKKLFVEIIKDPKLLLFIFLIGSLILVSLINHRKKQTGN